jgi:hypothetical protein
MINAAVMGLIGPLRYVLLTDALLESMDADQVEAVMAHEVAHVRRHHMPWMVVALVAALLVGVMTLNLPLLAIGAAGVVPQSWVPPMWLEVVLLVLELAVALAVFGWVSRRFERQADTFAVQHLSGMGRPDLERAATISPHAAVAMSAALERIAHLNALDPRQRSWRHGSIAWRQAYLASIIGRPLGDLAIDRVVRRIKLVAGLVVAAAIALQVALHYLPADAIPPNNLPESLRPSVPQSLLPHAHPLHQDARHRQRLHLRRWLRRAYRRPRGSRAAHVRPAPRHRRRRPDPAAAERPGLRRPPAHAHVQRRRQRVGDVRQRHPLRVQAGP